MAEIVEIKKMESSVILDGERGPLRATYVRMDDGFNAVLPGWEIAEDEPALRAEMEDLRHRHGR